MTRYTPRSRKATKIGESQAIHTEFEKRYAGAVRLSTRQIVQALDLPTETTVQAEVHSSGDVIVAFECYRWPDEEAPTFLGKRMQEAAYGEAPPCWTNCDVDALSLPGDQFVETIELTNEMFQRFRFMKPELTGNYQVDIFPPHRLGKDIATLVLNRAYRLAREAFEANPDALIGLSTTLDYSGSNRC